MSVQFQAVTRGGLWAIVRVLPSGEAAGYDPRGDMEQVDRHFQIHRGSAYATAIDCAFADSRKYKSLDAALVAAEEAGREVTPCVAT